MRKHYLIITLVALLGMQGCQSTTQESSREAVQTNPYPEFIELPAGTFLVGELSGKSGDNYRPGESASVNGFAISTTEITRGHWNTCVRAGKCKSVSLLSGSGDALPISNVNIDDIEDYIKWLNVTLNAVFRLPTEIEWEYAAKGGNNSRFQGSNSAAEVCNYGNVKNLDDASSSNSGGSSQICQDGFVKASAAKSFPPNLFGLYDLHGNVWEITADCWPTNDESNPLTSLFQRGCKSHIIKGGSFASPPEESTFSYRRKHDENKRSERVGFRLVRE